MPDLKDVINAGPLSVMDINLSEDVRVAIIHQCVNAMSELVSPELVSPGFDEELLIVLISIMTAGVCWGLKSIELKCGIPDCSNFNEE